MAQSRGRRRREEEGEDAQSKGRRSKEEEGEGAQRRRTEEGAAEIIFNGFMIILGFMIIGITSSLIKLSIMG